MFLLLCHFLRALFPFVTEFSVAAPLLTTFLGIGIQSKHSQFELCLICIDFIKFLISGNLVVAMVIVVVAMAIMAVAMMISSIR